MSGGLAGVHAWASAVAGRADEVVSRFPPGSGAAPGPELDDLVEQLTTLERLLPEDDSWRGQVVPRLGMLLSLRRMNGGAPGDREDALSRLRWADRHLPVHDAVGMGARSALVALLWQDLGGTFGQSGARGDVLPDAMLFGGGGKAVRDARATMAESGEVIDRLLAAPLPPALRQQLEGARRLLGTAAFGFTEGGFGRAHFDALRDLASAAPSGAFLSEEVIRAARTVVAEPATAEGPAEAEKPAAAAGTVAGPVAGPASALDQLSMLPALLTWIETARDEAERANATHATALTLHEQLGALRPDSPLRPLLTAMLTALGPHPDPGQEPPGQHGRPGVPPGLASALAELENTAGLFEELMRAAREGEPEGLERVAEQLRDLVGSLPEENREAQYLRLMLNNLPGLTGTMVGSLQDEDASVAMLRALESDLDRDPRGPVPAASFVGIALAVLRAAQELRLALRHGDESALPARLDELGRLHEQLPPDHLLRPVTAQLLGSASLFLGHRGGDPDRLRRAARLLREPFAEEQPMPLLGSSFASARALGLLVLTQAGGEDSADPVLLDEAVAAARGALESPGLLHQQESMLRYGLGAALHAAAGRTRDRARLDQAVDELSRVRELAAAGEDSVVHPEALAELARAHMTRSRLTAREEPGRPRADLDAALAVGREALAELTADVLLQLGAEHGLSTARKGAMLAQQMAHWALAARRGHEALEALELGRALVLRAAAASREVPQLLEERGHRELADQWRATEPLDLLRPDATEALLRTQADPSLPLMPSTLRRRALKALGAGTGSGALALLTVPGSAQVADGLAACGVDALVYLVPSPRAQEPGHALLLRPGAPPTALGLPGLALAAPALRRYLAAAAERSRPAGDGADRAEREAADEAWRGALEELCAWAWTAAMGPVLGMLGEGGGPGALPRVVLVPSHLLGVVPWHAAREGGAEADDGGQGGRYACREAVISYAPSAGELLRAARRDRLPVAERQVLLADPLLSLVWSPIEVNALHAGCYPGALRFGELLDAEPDAAGTPEEVLAALGENARPAAVLHLSCHASAGTSPTRSALSLAGEEELSVARILDRAARRAPAGGSGGQTAGAGPLVVLGACETDLSAGDHDEALTLATALVSAGAADVVGSRWSTRDGATALMMAVFHHHLAAGGLAPADALRAAQLWMLDRGRQPPSTLTDPALRREAARGDLHELPYWAAFTHQGNPTPALP
ncbi:CHAT domain-containing protein [Streptomyces sp. DSM 44917]|uniref:CHAT domain-containing protein n=1 Tax=Streptomyces boetiae TaxID=3075541 RepID=A0ABU2LDR1_9ACTN|nr:CHAT domain-containing protein [Streptomyces sp. DSM 44917]MDT0309724.1 CHAT domain-containing protein [Streptomyces sp. DSM 44917]